jgi:hypothetical protein
MSAGHTVAAVVAALGLAAAPAHAADGILISQKITTAGNTTTSQSQIEKTRMRSETVGANGRKQTLIFDGTAQVLRVVDDEAKTYSELTKDDVERISGQMSAAMGQMQQQMQNLPPEQRARMEAMMQSGRGMMGGMGGPPPEYKKIGTDKVGRWACDKYEGTKNGEKQSELCTVDPAALGFTAADFAVTKQLADFFSKMMPPGMDTLFRMGSAGPTGFSGIPIRVVGFRNGAQQTTSEMTDVGRQNFADALFTVPAGYTKREFPGMGRGRQ